MNKSAHISVLMLAVGMMVLAGCDPTLEMGGRKVKFTAVSNATPATKTHYGEIRNGYQWIAWNQGDQIRIYCPKDENGQSGIVGYSEGTAELPGDGHSESDETQWSVTPATFDLNYLYADYKVDNIDNDTSPLSKATLQNVDPNGLIWRGDAGAVFYAAYPYTTLISSSIDKKLRFAVQIPEGKTGSVTTGQTGAATDVQNMPLVAIQEATTSGEQVSLNFYPAFSAFEFHLKSGNDVNLMIDAFALDSEASGNEFLTGICYYDLNQITNKTSTNYDDHYLPNSKLSFDNGQKRLKIDVRQEVSSSSEHTFTLFTLPCTFNKLSIRVWYTPSGGSQKTKSLALTQNGQYISFPAGHKARIMGLALTEDLWKIFFEVGVDKWEELDPVTIEVD